MPIIIRGVTVSPQTVNVGSSFTIVVRAEEGTWGTLKDDYTTWSEVRSQFDSWAKVKDYQPKT